MAMGYDGCRWVTARLPLQAGGELLGLDRRRVERHLLSCPACRARLDALSSTLNLLHTAAQDPAALPEQGASLWPLVAQQIRESRHNPSRSSATLSLPSRWWGLRLALAASVLILAGFGVYQLQYKSPVVLRPWPPTIALRSRLAPPPVTVKRELPPAPPVTEIASVEEPDEESNSESDSSAPVGTAN